LGSGFVIDPKGFIVTNNHVIENADEIVVNFSNGDSADAELVGTDPKTDLALLKLIDTPAEPLPFVNFGDSEAARVGDWVLAIGNPFGLGGSVSAGIISARNRNINSGPYDDFLQTDAAINRGNSGGPLFNMDGDVIGVNTAIYSPTGGSVGVGFSVPSNIAMNVIDQLREFGEIRRGWIGVRIREVSEELAEGLELADARGALVEDVTEDGPAAEAGVEIGDVILSFDGKDVEEMRDLPKAVAETPAGDTVRMVVSRKGKSQTLKVTVGLLDAEGNAVSSDEDDSKSEEAVETEQVLGMTMTTLDRKQREEFGLKPDQKGVLITEVESTSAAAKKGLRKGDVIVEVAQESVSTPDAVMEQVKAQKADGKSSVLLLVSRKGDVRFVALRFEDAEDD
jgi:serine protease Do